MTTTARDRAIDRLESGFMTPEVFKGGAWEVTTLQGETQIIPHAVCSAEADLAQYVDGDIDEAEDIIDLSNVWLARMSANGYMDCTDWTAHNSEEEAYDYLIEYYDDGDDDTDSDDDSE